MEGINLELEQVMQEVLLSLLGEPDENARSDDAAGDAYDASPPEAAQGEPRLTCAVNIRGGWNGQVIVQASLGLASLAATRMFGAQASSVLAQTDAQDALREIANIVAGNLKPLFGHSNDLGLPEDLSVDSLFPPSAELAQAVVQHRSGSLEVRVFEKR